MPTFGYESKGPTQEVQPWEIFGSWFSCPEAGTANSITAYLIWAAAPYSPPKVKYAIYKKSDGSLVGYTEEWTVSPGWDGWKTLNMIWGGILEAADYWLVAWFSDYEVFFPLVYVEAGRGAYSFSQKYNSFPASFPIQLLDAHKHSIYCTYTTVAPPQYTLTLASDRPAYYVDEIIPLSGVLTVDGVPITGAPVVLYRNGIPHLETVTLADGSYGFADPPTVVGALEYHTEHVIGELILRSTPLKIRRN